MATMNSGTSHSGGTSNTVGTAPAYDAARMLNQCLRKKVFRQYRTADRVAQKWNQLSSPGPGLVFHVYGCPLCGKYHVGRTRKEK